MESIEHMDLHYVLWDVRPGLLPFWCNHETVHEAHLWLTVSAFFTYMSSARTLIHLVSKQRSTGIHLHLTFSWTPQVGPIYNIQYPTCVLNQIILSIQHNGQSFSPQMLLNSWRQRAMSRSVSGKNEWRGQVFCVCQVRLWWIVGT